MSKSKDKVLYKDLSYLIVGVLFEVYNELGFGYSEKVYERAVAKSFEDRRINYIQQAPYKIVFKDQIIGRNYIDFIVENCIVLELKKGDYFSRKNIEQIKKYLKITNLKLAIIANFTSKGVKTFRAFNPNNK